ncbi:hypothetical protein JTE90_012074 [Oedothorax gibbosus]|uniref:Uncharacterized protein n=1 Tax=Oedothorax gibbosus TaxID=931172 RepID=A0AAV6U652_9ARAC|nr:hypothetical protein JTE90_012074 [Oedothorax gibbosus]
MLEKSKECSVQDCTFHTIKKATLSKRPHEGSSDEDDDIPSGFPNPDDIDDNKINAEMQSDDESNFKDVPLRKAAKISKGIPTPLNSFPSTQNRFAPLSCPAPPSSSPLTPSHSDSTPSTSTAIAAPTADSNNPATPSHSDPTPSTSTGIAAPTADSNNPATPKDAKPALLMVKIDRHIKTLCQTITNYVPNPPTFSTAGEYLKILSSFSEFEGQGSGWIIDEILHLEVNTAVYIPLGAASYIPLPKELLQTRSILNIQNSDNKCFLWSVLADLHPVPDYGLGLQGPGLGPSQEGGP